MRGRLVAFLHFLRNVLCARSRADGKIPAAAPIEQFFRVNIDLNRINSFVAHPLERFPDMHKPVIIGILKLAPVRRYLKQARPLVSAIPGNPDDIFFRISLFNHHRP